MNITIYEPKNDFNWYISQDTFEELLDTCTRNENAFTPKYSKKYLLAFLNLLAPNDIPYTSLTNENKAIVLPLLEKYGPLLVAQGKLPRNKYLLNNGHLQPDFMAKLRLLHVSFPISMVMGKISIMGLLDIDTFQTKMKNSGYDIDFACDPIIYIQGERKDE